MMRIAMDGIRLDGGTQPRAVINSPLFEEYAQAIADGAVFPPIVVFFDGSEYWLADGYHRFHAHRTLGLADIEADVRQGDRRGAVLHSVGANADHGWRRSNDDKRRAVAALLSDPEWARWSDHEIARQCRVSQPFVSKLRPQLAPVETDDNLRTYRDRRGAVGQMNIAGQRASRGDPVLVAGRVPDRTPNPSVAASSEVGLGTASAATGIKLDKLRRIAASGEIEGARKESGSWVFETDKLKAWMSPTGVTPAPAAEDGGDEIPLYDHEANQPMHAAIDQIEALVTGVTPVDLLRWWATYLGKGFDNDTVERVSAWITQFAEGYPAAERARRALLARIPEEKAA